MGRAVEADILPDLVADHGEIVRHAGFGQMREFGFTGRSARRVERIVEHDHARFRRDCGGKCLGAVTPFGRRQRHRDWHPASTAHHRRVGIVGRLEQDHFIARADQREHRIGNRLCRA